MEDKLYFVDSVMWQVDKYSDFAIPICPKDKIELSYVGANDFMSDEYTDRLKCEDCDKVFVFKRNVYNEKKYVVEKVRALDRKDYEIIDVDGIKTPVTKKERLDLNDGYFCTAQVRDSKRGSQVVIYAGKKGLKEKSQILITPEERRLSFDQNDLNPADVFTRVIAEFYDGTKYAIEKDNDDK